LGSSVPSSRSTRNCSGVNSSLHSSSVFSTVVANNLDEVDDEDDEDDEMELGRASTPTEERGRNP
jgi:hypothetical protein